MIAYLSLSILLAAICLIAFLLLGRLDTRSEAHMHDPRHPLRDHLRDWLGINHLHEHLRRMGATMATATEQLNELKSAFSDFASDVTAKLDQLAAAQGDLNPEAQAVFDEIKQAVADADARVGDADGSDGSDGSAEPTGEVPPAEGNANS